MSILDQIHQIGQISRSQKRNEYIRFCNMLQRLIDLDPWSESMRLLQVDDDDLNRSGKTSNGYGSIIMSYK